MLSVGFGSVAGIPPQLAQSPMAIVYLATCARTLTHSSMGRPANRFHSPVPLGALMTVPSNTRMSSGTSPDATERSSRLRLSPSSIPSEGCHRILIPKSVTRSQTLGSSAFRKDMVLPEQAPPCSQRRFVICPPADHRRMRGRIFTSSGTSPWYGMTRIRYSPRQRRRMARRVPTVQDVQRLPSRGHGSLAWNLAGARAVCRVPRNANASPARPR
jgi:hypothetical protein